MIDSIPRISIFIITYNQEDLIGRALDSLISQKDYIYEICVSDDCSKDNTWQVLQDYQGRYSELIKIHRNDPNVGIFANFEQVWTMPTGDMVYGMAGDDEAGPGWFKKVVEYIEENKIDYKNELFCIYGNSKVVYPNGDSYIGHNSAVGKYPNALRLALRDIITNRSACYSIKVLWKYDKVSQGKSHIAETAQDRMLQLYSEKNYYINSVGHIYYGRIGVSVHINEETFKERLKIWPYAESYLESKGVVFSRLDKNYGKYHTAWKIFRHKHSLRNFFRLLWYYIISRDFSLPAGDALKIYIFAILRRLPHKKQLSFK